MAVETPACTSCGRDLRPHCAQLNVEVSAHSTQPASRCGWWRCTNHVCGVDMQDFRRGVRRLTTGEIEPIPRSA